MTLHLNETAVSTHSLRLSLAGLTVAFLAAGCGGGTNSSSDSAASAQAADVAPMPDALAADVESGGEVTKATALRWRRPAPTPAPAPAPAPAPTPAPSPAPAPAPAPAGATCGLPDFQASVLARINQYRAAGASCRTAGQFAPAQPLVWNSLLLQAASGHSQDMATKNYFSHTGLDGRTMVDRINATGYVWSTIGENIAAGYPTVNAVVDGWMASDGHCANLMNPNFKDVGVACVASSTSTYRTYWTMDAGKQR
jgi:uncharacterized protein YkwD